MDDLIGLEQRIDRHENGAGSGRAETRNHELDTLFEINRNAARWMNSETDETGGELLDRAGKTFVSDLRVAVLQRNGVGRVLRGSQGEFMQKNRVHSMRMRVAARKPYTLQQRVLR